MKKAIDKYIDLMVENVTSGHFICPSCFGEPLDKLCPTCQFFNGISLKDIVENNWTSEDILKASKKLLKTK